MLRLPLLLTRRFVSYAPRANDRFKTYPRPIGNLIKYIKKEDIVREMHGYRLIRARPEHAPLLRQSMEDFVLSEPTNQGAGMTTVPDDLVWPFLFNATRYPYSYFALNQENEIVNLLLADLVEKDPSKAELPRLELGTKNPRDAFSLVGRVIDWVEQKHLSNLGVDAVIHGEVVYTPSVLRRRHINQIMMLACIELVCKSCQVTGIRYTVGVTTGEANKKNMQKLGFTIGEQIPAELYTDYDGKPWRPHGEDRANLCVLDMDWAWENKIFEKWTER